MSRVAGVFVVLLNRPEPFLQFRFSRLGRQSELPFPMVLGRRLQIELRLAGVQVARPTLKSIDQFGRVQP